jgi:AmmeMemoRadiSam system protein B/AmmeMemoRadiSam system protein A
MKKSEAAWLVVLSLFLIATNGLPQSNQGDRQPAVAGQFYPSQRNELEAELKNLFSKAVPPKHIKNVIAIISPHAGYVYSGEVAASAFNQIDPTKEYENIFLLGPSHHVALEGASAYASGNYVTPLGTVKVNRQLGEQLAKEHPVFTNEIEPHVYEHSIEVQLPFLQYCMKKKFQIVPIVVGAPYPETCRQMASVLRPYLNTKNLFIISTDFSHYPSYDDAVRVDKTSADAVLSNSAAKLIEVTRSNEQKGISNLVTTMCGWSCVLTLLYMTENDPNIAVNLIEYKNSGDSEVGDKTRVVGYCAIVFSLKDKGGSSSSDLSENDKKKLLWIARNTIEQYVKEKQIPAIDTTPLSVGAKTNRGAFVTLLKNGELRGCIGRFDANEPLYRVVQHMAISAATEDYRFPQVQADEIGSLQIEISALTPMRRISSIDEIELGRDGIYIRKGDRSGTFLPQVATETGWTKEEFLSHCAHDKAGLGWDGWKDAEIYVYEANVFSEKEMSR